MPTTVEGAGRLWFSIQVVKPVHRPYVLFYPLLLLSPTRLCERSETSICIIGQIKEVVFVLHAISHKERPSIAADNAIRRSVTRGDHVRRALILRPLALRLGDQRPPNWLCSPGKATLATSAIIAHLIEPIYGLDCVAYELFVVGLDRGSQPVSSSLRIFF